ncbi:ER membrane protein complex subunit 10 [Chelonus insularis]|uniref:ER membrane protein complex subunit 10 n=1 Tax=Chelonus insularis TaxID=460826 RepID=UPI00158A06C3|nr:ER membrane protein complex subunit 10 [Chelonus insularis]
MKLTCGTYIVHSFCLSFIIANELDYNHWIHLRLYHALNNHATPYFIERGNITITHVRSGQSVINQRGLQLSQLSDLKTIADNNEKYRLKITAHSSLGTETTFLTSVPACHLFGTSLEDILILWLDMAGEIISITQVSPGPCIKSSPSSTMWTTSVQVRFPDSGLMPDTTSYMYKLEKEKEARERGETKDSRSFLAKYWMYIVPALIFVVLTSAANPDGATGNSGVNNQR